MTVARASEKTPEAPKGVHDSEPLKNTVGDYPERPYSEAISPEHRAHLKELGETVADVKALEG